MAGPLRYLSAADIAALFGVLPGTVETWRSRFGPDRDPEATAKAPSFPEPDARIGPFGGWLPEREEEIRAWRRSLPGSGAGGGRPRKG